MAKVLEMFGASAKEYSRPGSSYVVSREFPPRPESQMGGRLPTASRQSRPIDILEEDRVEYWV